MKFILLFILPTLSETSNESDILCEKKITLNSNNVLTLKGTVNEEMSTNFIYSLNKKKNKENLFVYLDTHGGSVEFGNQIVYEIRKHKLNCIADKAYSMGFVILQSCYKRYITPFGRIMQHQISYGLQNEKAKIESYVNFVDQIEDELTEMQASRIGISNEKFVEKTYNDWWLVGKKAVLENCADQIADVRCSVKLTNENYTKSDGFNEFTYSKCPLVTGHIAKKPVERQNLPFFFYVEN